MLAREDIALSSERFCFSSVAERFDIDAQLLESISWVESRHDPNAVNVNNPKSIDYGHMQINSYWIDFLGEDYKSLNDPCFCTRIGAEILLDCIRSHGYNRNALSCYNSGKSLDRLSPPVQKNVLDYIRKIEARYDHLSIIHKNEEGK